MAKPPKAPHALTHDQIWTALDRLAERAGLSPSGLAKRAGLDPTPFNKSKRITPARPQRWARAAGAAARLRASGGRRLFRRWWFSGRQGLGRGGPARRQ